MCACPFEVYFFGLGWDEEEVIIKFLVFSAVLRSCIAPVVQRMVLVVFRAVFK